MIYAYVSVGIVFAALVGGVFCECWEHLARLREIRAERAHGSTSGHCRIIPGRPYDDELCDQETNA